MNTAANDLQALESQIDACIAQFPTLMRQFLMERSNEVVGSSWQWKGCPVMMFFKSQNLPVDRVCHWDVSFAKRKILRSGLPNRLARAIDEANSANGWNQQREMKGSEVLAIFELLPG